jgi:hypothetical protein
MTNLLPKDKRLIGRALRLVRGSIRPKMGKLRIFWEVVAEGYRITCANTQKSEVGVGVATGVFKGASGGRRLAAG